MSTPATTTDAISIAFVCVQNAGRSQMATAFAERERAERGLEEYVEILTGGTDPADHIHEEVVAVMDEDGFDLAERVPREITTGELESSDYVATMGCSTLSLEADAHGDGPDVRDWALADPDGEDRDHVREIREEVRSNVASLFDEIEVAVDRRVDAE